MGSRNGSITPRKNSGDCKPATSPPFHILEYKANEEQHELKVDTKKIASAWPSDRGDVPTPRAISERLVKIRQNSRAASASHPGTPSSQKNGVQSSAPAKTMSAHNTPTKTPIGKPISARSPAKRKHETSGTEVIKTEDGNGFDILGEQRTPKTPTKQTFTSRLSTGHDLATLVTNPDVFTTPTKRMRGLNVTTTKHDPSMGTAQLDGQSDVETINTDELGSPVKRPRRVSSAHKVLAESEDEDVAESDISEWEPQIQSYDGVLDDEEVAV